MSEHSNLTKLLDEHLECLQFVTNTVGPVWYAKALSDAQALVQSNEARRRRKGTHEMFRADVIHPIVRCGLILPHWIETCKRLRRFHYRDEIEQIYNLGVWLKCSKDLPGFSNGTFAARLKDASRFPGAAFELEVA